MSVPEKSHKRSETGNKKAPFCKGALKNFFIQEISLLRQKQAL